MRERWQLPVFELKEAPQDEPFAKRRAQHKLK